MLRTMDAEVIDTATRIETPEHIEFEFRIAGPWRRCWAYAIDLILRMVIMTAAVFLMSLSIFVFTGFDDLLEAHAGLMLLTYFVVEWFYYVLFEWLRNGCTPGKTAVGLRVVKEGGFPINLQDALLRNLLRAADLLPTVPGVLFPTYLVGILVSANDPRFRRLGDLVAGTMVIAEEPARLKDPVLIDPPPQPQELASVPPHPRLNIEEKRTIDAFMRRFRMIHPDRREELCRGYAEKLAKRLGAPVPRSGARFLQLVYARMAEAATPLRRSGT